MSTPREHILDDELKKLVARENAERLLKASNKITETENSSAKSYLTETRKIPLSTLLSCNIKSLEAEVPLLKYDEITGKITEEKRRFNSTLTPVYDLSGSLIGVHLVHLNGAVKATNDNNCKEIIGEQSDGKVALVQSSLNTTKVYIAEGIETAASVASFSGIQGRYDVLASLGITELSKTLAYVKANYPPGCTIVLLKDHDVPKPSEKESDANVAFDKTYEVFVNAGFQVVVKQPKNPDEDWNDVLVKGISNSQYLTLEDEFTYTPPYQKTSSADVVGGESNPHITEAFLDIKGFLNVEEKKAKEVNQLNELVKLIAEQQEKLKKLKSEAKPTTDLGNSEIKPEASTSQIKTDVSALLANSKEMEKVQLNIQKLILLAKAAHNIDLSDITIKQKSNFEKLYELYKIKRQEQQKQIKVVHDDAEDAMAKYREVVNENNLIRLEKLKALEKLSEIIPSDEYLEDIKLTLQNLTEDQSRGKDLTNVNITDKVHTNNKSLENSKIENIREQTEPEIQKILKQCEMEISGAIDDTQATFEAIQKRIEVHQEKLEREKESGVSPYDFEKMYLQSQSTLPGEDSKKILQNWLNALLSSYSMGKSMDISPWAIPEHSFAGENARLTIGDVDEEKVLLNLTIEILNRSGIENLLDSEIIQENNEKIEQLMLYSLELATSLYKTFKVAIPGSEKDEQEFDGVMLQGGLPTLIERKSNEGTGPEELQRNFITAKLQSKLKFYNRVDGADPEGKKKETTATSSEKEGKSKLGEDTGIKQKSEAQSKKDESSNSDSEEENDYFDMFKTEEEILSEESQSTVGSIDEISDIEQVIVKEGVIPQEISIEPIVVTEPNNSSALYDATLSTETIVDLPISTESVSELTESSQGIDNPETPKKETSDSTFTKTRNFEIKLDPEVEKKATDEDLMRLMLAAKSIANDAVNQRRIELTLNKPDDPEIHKTISSVLYPQNFLGDISIRLSNEDKGKEQVSNQKTDEAKIILENKIKTSEFKKTLLDHLRDRKQGFAPLDQESTSNKDQKKSSETENQKTEKKSTASEMQKSEKKLKEELDKSKEKKQSGIDSTNENLFTKKGDQKYQLLSHDINYVGQSLINDSGSYPHTIFLDVQQSHSSIQSISLKRSLNEEGGLVQQALEQNKCIISAFNKDANHWTAYMIVPDGMNLSIIYKDSYGNPPPLSFKEAFQALKEKGYNIQFIYDPNVEQRDNVSCGLFALKNMEILAKMKVTSEMFDGLEISKSGDKVISTKPSIFFTPTQGENLAEVRGKFASIYQHKSDSVQMQGEIARNFIDLKQDDAEIMGTVLNDLAIQVGKSSGLSIKKCEARTREGNVNNWFFDFEFNNAKQLQEFSIILKFLKVPHEISDFHLQISPENAQKISESCKNSDLLYNAECYLRQHKLHSKEIDTGLNSSSAKGKNWNIIINGPELRYPDLQPLLEGRVLSLNFINNLEDKELVKTLSDSETQLKLIEGELKIETVFEEHKSKQIEAQTKPVQEISSNPEITSTTEVNQQQKNPSTFTQ